MKSAEDDQYRVVIQKESNDALEELVRRTNNGFEGGEVTKSDVVNLLISNHAKSFSDSDIKSLRLLHFDEKKVLRALLRKAGDDGDLPSEIKKVIREHLGISLPRFWQWDRGEQASILRTFCKEIGLKSVKFHTLRACFATQLLGSGVSSVTVQKICGWKDLKTIERYVRLAGVDERGATESLRFLPTDADVMAQVVNLCDFKAENR